MTWLMRLTISVGLATMATATPAQVGGHDGETFVDLVRQGDSSAAIALLQSKPIIIDAVDARGDTALLAAIRNRDHDWTAHLLRAGANPNLAPRNGDTPLIAAARAGFDEAVEWLLGLRAKVDAANRMGETPLIAAVQARQTTVVKRLLEAGANPDKTDSAQGYSARDYAKRDTRSREILALIEGGKAKPAKEAQSVDDFRLDKKN